MKDQKLYEFIYSELKDRQPVVLLLIAETKGSSAGKSGFKCAVGKNKTVGTIGGGAAEYQMIKEAQEILLLDDSFQNLRTLAHNPKSKIEKSGMICSGQQTSIIQKLETSDLDTIEKLLESSQLRTKPGILKISENKLQFIENTGQDKRIVFQKTEDGNFSYSEQIGLPDTLYIVGGGHVGAACAEIFSHLNFYIKVFDDRQELEIFKQIQSAHEKIVIEYPAFKEQIKKDENKYILIMTAEHSSDQTVLEQALKSNARYIGMLGSKAKINTIFKNLKNKGFKSEELQKVYTPAGLPIASDTPYEIAVSIAAEIIDVRAKQ